MPSIQDNDRSIPNLSRLNKFDVARMRMRSVLWPDVVDAQLWDRRKSKGFASIPRTLPLICVIADRCSKGKPVSSVLFDLWSRVYDEGFVRVDRPRDMAISSGFTTARGIHIWAERLQILERLAFIRIARGAGGSATFILIFNPYQVIKRLFNAGNVDSALFHELTAQAFAIGAEDLSDDFAGVFSQEKEETQL
jgi:hypothetical protein